MTVTTIGSSTDSYSSPYYDYATDALYVGDNASHLYKVVNIFDNDTTNPTSTSVTLNVTAYDVASPTYDSTSGCVFVGDSQGYLYKVNSGVTGTVCTSGSFGLNATSALLGASTTAQLQGIFDAPLVDSTAETVYAFVNASAAISVAGSGTCATNNNCIVQFLTNFGSSGAPNGLEPLGIAHAKNVSCSLYDGAFDNVYYSSSDPPSGNIYVVGASNSSSSFGHLYKVPINSNSLGAPSSVANLSSASISPFASPVTEFCNPDGASACAVSTGGFFCGAGNTCTTTGTDYIFFSAYEVDVTTTGGSSACALQTGGEGCVISWIVNSPAALPSTPASDMAVTFPDGGSKNGFTNPGCWGTGAFVIDNSSMDVGASNIYFPNMNGNSASAASSSVCEIVSSKTIQAVQVSQSSL